MFIYIYKSQNRLISKSQNRINQKQNIEGKKHKSKRTCRVHR